MNSSDIYRNKFFKIEKKMKIKIIVFYIKIDLKYKINLVETI